jgi:hypothetical protein
MNKKIELLIAAAILELEKEDRRVTDSNILMKLRCFTDIEIESIINA